MTVDAIMTRRVVTVEREASLLTVHNLFRKGAFHHLLVVDGDGGFVGVISDRDVLKEVSPFLDTPSETHRDVHTLAKPVHTLIKRAPVTVEKSAGIEAAAALLLDEGVSCLPVLAPDGEIEGLVTSRDILRHTAGRQPDSARR